MIKQHSDRVQLCLETLCSAGCQSVRVNIVQLERGEVVQGMENLSAEERYTILHELKAIMAVYEQDCS